VPSHCDKAFQPRLREDTGYPNHLNGTRLNSTTRIILDSVWIELDPRFLLSCQIGIRDDLRTRESQSAKQALLDGVIQQEMPLENFFLLLEIQITVQLVLGIMAGIR